MKRVLVARTGARGTNTHIDALPPVAYNDPPGTGIELRIAGVWVGEKRGNGNANLRTAALE